METTLQGQGARRRAGGRDARHRLREAGPTVRPVWPGMPGGRYRPLTDAEVARVHETSLDILEAIGLNDVPDAWRERVVAAGGRVTGEGRLCFPRALVEECIGLAGRGFTLRGREPAHDLDVSGARVHFGGGSATVEILDVAANRFRETTLLDLYDISRLEDALDPMHFVIRACVARDLAEADALDLNTAYAIMSGTAKHMVTSFFQPEHLEQAVAMFDLSLGGNGDGSRWRERPFASAIVTYAVSPLRLAADSCAVLDAAVRHGMPAILISVPQAGATAPAALAGTLALGNAEVLAGLTAMNLLSPGHPLLMGHWPFVADLRSGAFCGGGGEMALLAAGAAQMARYYDIPSSVGSGMTSSKQPDLQAGWEKGYLTTLPALAGANMVMQSTGILADIIACSPEAFMLDSDLVGGVQRAVRGFEVDDDALSLEVIREAATGPGHFLAHPRTLALMESEYVYPRIADRASIKGWEAAGRQDLRERGREHLRAVLSRHYPAHVPPGCDARIRERFDIRLRRDDMVAACGRW